MPASVTSLSSSPSSFCPQVSTTAAAVLNGALTGRGRRPGDFDPPSVHPVALELLMNGGLSPTQQPPPLPLKMSALAAQHKRQAAAAAASSFRACLDGADNKPHAKHDAAAIIKCLNGAAIGKARDDDAVVPLLPREEVEAQAEVVAQPPPLKKTSAPQPPVPVADKQSPHVESRDVIVKQPNGHSAHILAEQQAEDLIRFSADNPPPIASPNGGKSLPAQKAIREQPSGQESDLDDDDDLEAGPGAEQPDEDDRPGSPDSVKTADEQMDYLEGLESCPCYAKCCIDSIVTLFCVTLLG